MLVSELRKEIDKYDKRDLENIVVELYKKIPKSIKDDYNIDGYICDINNKIIQQEVTIDDLKKEIDYFISCVDNDYYAIPNSVVSKKDRSNWRFKVKRYYKDLNKYLPDTKEGIISTRLLIDIFERLSLGSNELKFTDWDTFRAIGVTQSDYYDNIVKRILLPNFSERDLKLCIDLLDVYKDPGEYSINMFETLISNLKTVKDKNTTIQIMKERVKNIKDELKSLKKGGKYIYDLTEDNNLYTNCIVKIYFNIYEAKKGIKYFQDNYIESSRESKEYVLLNLLEDNELYGDWIREYEEYEKKVDYRDSLKERYSSIKNH